MRFNEDLLNEAKRHFNEPVLICLDLCRCVGYGEDDEDCYLIVLDPRRGLRRQSFVGGYTFLDSLRGQNYVKSPYTGEEWDDFTRLDSLLRMNGSPKRDEFTCEVPATPGS